MFFSGTMNIPEKKASIATIRAPSINGFKYLLKDIPELKIAITSELLAILDVNQITERKTKSG